MVENKSFNSSTVPAFTHCSIPFFQTKLSTVSCLAVAICAKTEISNGPVACPYSKSGHHYSDCSFKIISLHGTDLDLQGFCQLGHNNIIAHGTTPFQQILFVDGFHLFGQSRTVLRQTRSTPSREKLVAHPA